MALIDELKDDLKKERFEKLFKAYAKYLVAAFILIIAGTAAGVWYKDYTLKRYTDTGEKYRIAIEKTDNISQLDEVINTGSAGYRDLALLRKAASFTETDEAVKFYDSIYADPAVDYAIRELAALMAVHLLIDDGKNDITIDSRLSSFSETSPWRFSAVELRAIYSLQNDDTDRAVRIFESLQGDPLAPSDMKSRASKMLKILSTASISE